MHLRRALALSLAVPLLLAGCTEKEPTPDIPDPTTSSATPTPEETETAEAESAEEFIRRWVEAGDEMQVTGDTSEYLAMVEKSCEACQSFASSVEDVYDSGGSIEFDGTTVDRIARREASPPTFALTKTLPDTTISRGGAAEPEVLPAGKTTLLVILKRSSADWADPYYGIL